MRNISFMLTTDQIKARTKTVTRRTGWAKLVPGQLLIILAMDCASRFSSGGLPSDISPALLPQVETNVKVPTIIKERQH